MDKKVSETINNICTILGGALLLYPLIDEAAKTIMPEMEKLQSGETLEQLKLPPPSQEQAKEKEDRESKDNELAELKRKIQEYEQKEQAAKQEHE